MRVLALDMTILNTGYSVWEWLNVKGRWRWFPAACGCISPAMPGGRDYKMMKDLRRCQELLREFDQLATGYDICAVVVELLAGTQNSQAAKTFGLVQGVLAAFLEKYALPVYIYNAQAVKKTLTGRKNASKDEVIEAVLELYPEFCKENGFRRKKSPKTGKLQWPTKLEHVADSMGLIIHAEDQADFRIVAQMAQAAKRETGIENDPFFE